MKITSRELDVIDQSLKDKLSFLELARKLSLSVVKTSRRLGAIASESKTYADAFRRHNWPININKGFIYLGSFETLKTSESKQLFNIKTRRGIKVGGSLCEGERLGLLKPGDYVLRGEWENDKHVEIFTAHQVEETKYQFLTLSFISKKKGDKLIDGRKEKRRYEILNNIADSMVSRGLVETDNSLIEIRKKIKDVLVRNLKLIHEEWISKYQISCGKLEEFKESPYNCKYKINTGETRIVYYPGKSLGTPNKRSLISVLNDLV